jgi:hypothetical protein
MLGSINSNAKKLKKELIRLGHTITENFHNGSLQAGEPGKSAAAQSEKQEALERETKDVALI